MAFILRARRLRTRIGIVLLAILGPIAVAVAAAPYLIDVDAYKPAMVAAVKEATGRELVIEGPMKLSMFPRPRISARQVRFANAIGTKGAQMADVRWVGVSPSWWALLRGDVEVGRLTLYKPTIILEADANGIPNWEFKPGAGAAQPEGAASSGFHLAVGRLRIVQGTISYTNPHSGKTLTAEQIDATASAGSLDGPFELVGSATVNGIPLNLDFAMGGPEDKGHRTRLSLKVKTGALDFTGRVSKIAPGAEVRGQLSVTSGVLTDFIGALLTATGGVRPAFERAVAGQFLFDGGIEVTPTRIALQSFRVSLAGDTASGTLALDYGAGAPSLSGELALAKVDIDQWLKVIEQPSSRPPGAPGSQAMAEGPADAQGTSSAKITGATKAPTPPTAESQSLSPFPKALTLALTLEVAQALHANGTVRDLSAAIEIRNGEIAIPRLRAVLPGEMRLEASSSFSGDLSRPVATGDIRLSGSRLRETLSWLGVRTSGVPAGRLQTLDATGKMMSGGNKLQVSDVAFTLDGDTSGTGSGTLTLSAPIAATGQVELPNFDLDAYMPKAPEPAVSATAEKLTVEVASRVEAVAAAAGIAPPPAPSFGLKAKVSALRYRGETAKGVEADVVLQGNQIRLNDAKVGDLLGAKLGLKGSITEFGTLPKFDLAYNATIPDADRLLTYAELPSFMNGRIGAATVSGRLNGTRSALTLSDTAVTMLGATARASGTLTLSTPAAFDFGNLTLDADDASRLFSAASGHDLAGVGGLHVEGSLKGTEERVAFNGAIDVLGTAMNGAVDATLDRRPSVTASLTLPGTLDMGRWIKGPEGAAAGAPSAPPPASGPNGASTPAVSPPASPQDAAQSLDMSPLKAFDAVLKLKAGAVVLAPYRLDEADLAAQLRGGVLTIEGLSGRLFGGDVGVNGRIDASGKTLALELAGNASGLDLASVLRSTAGTNAFGDSDLEIAIDGRLDVTGLRFSGSGSSPDEIVRNLNGEGTLAGFVHPAISKGSRGLALFATSIAGIFSDEMAFNRVLLESFIDRQTPVAGTIRLSGGTVMTDDQVVRGQSANAFVVSRVDLLGGTTETTVSISNGQTASEAMFTARVSGPIGAPTLTTTRGR